jgi:DNA-binding transcriptional regulator YhcF (GntR family)/tRNA A-37 threonylcarbamoyl transferase component Bud32
MATPPPPTDAQPSLNDPRRLLLEQTLGAQYEILRQLGQGGAGVVYLARERLLERLVAIKLLRSELVADATKERFVREARTAAKLMHAHIVPLYSFGQAGDTLYYIMGYVEGESLEAMLQRVGRVDADEARRILVEVADALDYAHRNGVVHRDVKPDNILIDRDSRRAILTDFGIAKTQATQSTLTATGMIVGTPLYMSPEQAAGDTIDGRSDLYSLGVIGYRMVAGRLPIEGTSAQDVMRRHVMQNPTPLSEVAPSAPVDLSWAIMRCLDKEPSRRWPTVEALRQALESGDGSAGELPEQLQHLSGRAGAAVFVATFFAGLGLLAFALSGVMWQLLAGLALAILSMASVGVFVRSARRFGLDSHGALRLVAAPPERWTGWWPSGFRRPGDVWDRLPREVRRARASKTLLLATTALIGPLGAALLSVGGVSAAVVCAVAIAAAAAHLKLSLTAASQRLRGNGIPERSVFRWVDEPTWNAAFFRRPEAIAALAVPAAPKLAIDSPDKDPYCVTTPTQPELPQGMFDHIDPRSPTPLYAQIASRLRVAIASGELRPGDGLPSVRQLSGRLRINPATVVQAYRELELEGLVNTRQGAGTFVQDVAPDRKTRDRAQEARRLVREMLAQAGSIGITASDLRAAIEQELNGKPR